MKNILVHLPLIEIQKKIGMMLGVLDDKIDFLMRENKILEQISEVIFKSWFVDFDGQKEFVDSEFGEIPKGWKIFPLSEYVEILSGGTPKTSNSAYWNGKIKWVSVKDSSSGPYIVDTEKTITDLGVEKSNAKKFPKETIVITARGTVGNLALMSETMTINQSCYGLKTKQATNQLFLFNLIKENLHLFLKNVHGSVFDTITRDTFSIVKVIVPPLDLIQKYENYVRPLYDEILSNQISIKKLNQTKDTLLPKLMSGEIRV